jgi:tRNA dimethylallyltransferase
MKILVICGPTASGKTDLSIEIGQKFSAEIINFDSLCLYQELNIGTAKPEIDQRTLIPHHMIDVTSAKTNINAASYREMTLPIIKEIQQRGKNIILVGGSGFYLQALIKGMYHSPSTPEEILKKSDQVYSQDGIRPFLEILQINDPISFEMYHQNDHYRIRRAVEHWWTHQAPFSKERINYQVQTPQDWNIKSIFLDLPKEEHWTIIQNRTLKMLKKGWLEEVQHLLANGFTGNEKPLQSVGYKDIISHLHHHSDLATTIERINISNRQLAKSQRTWFKRELQKRYHPIAERNEIHSLCEEFFMDLE